MSPNADPLTCPKCGGPMRSYERNGVTVDQCSDCRGIFLDRGELDRLIDAEDAHYDRSHDRPAESRGQKPRKKKKSFLENLMEGMGE
jgi:uncharacterized protein